MELWNNRIEKHNPQIGNEYCFVQLNRNAKHRFDYVNIDIAENSSIKTKNARNELITLLNQISEWLIEDESVKLDEYDGFWLSYSSMLDVFKPVGISLILETPAHGKKTAGSSSIVFNSEMSVKQTITLHYIQKVSLGVPVCL
jgi:hypothetical protein